MAELHGKLHSYESKISQLTEEIRRQKGQDTKALGPVRQLCSNSLRSVFLKTLCVVSLKSKHRDIARGHILEVSLENSG